jgi:hypothetical protein
MTAGEHVTVEIRVELLCPMPLLHIKLSKYNIAIFVFTGYYSVRVERWHFGGMSGIEENFL